MSVIQQVDLDAAIKRFDAATKNVELAQERLYEARGERRVAQDELSNLLTWVVTHGEAAVLIKAA